MTIANAVAAILRPFKTTKTVKVVRSAPALSQSEAQFIASLLRGSINEAQAWLNNVKPYEASLWDASTKETPEGQEAYATLLAVQNTRDVVQARLSRIENIQRKLKAQMKVPD